LNTTGSSVSATCDPIGACCCALFDATGGGLRAAFDGVAYLVNDRRWRARSGLRRLIRAG